MHAVIHVEVCVFGMFRVRRVLVARCRCGAAEVVNLILFISCRVFLSKC